MNIPTQIELQSIRALLPYARNSRTHSDEQVAQVAASIREFGWTNPDVQGLCLAWADWWAEVRILETQRYRPPVGPEGMA
jgi:hypothetical protein